MLDFPAPDADALEQSSRLVALMRDEIAAFGGWMPFYRYMELALHAPGLGYYAGGMSKFGAGGDFVTAPELTPLFGQALAAQAGEIMRASARDMIEVGAGSGHLAADLLLELERRDCLPERYGILELSAELRARQREMLARRIPRLAARVHWLDTLPETFSGVVVANEVLDAMPLHVIAVRDGTIFERGVALAASDAARAFVWADRPARGAVLDAALRLPLPPGDGVGGEYVTEINLAAAAWISAWSGRLRKGAMLLIDYGYPRDEFYLPSRACGTLMCHYRHRAHDDPFLWPGLADVTGSVDFTAMAEAGFDAGLDVLGYASQGQFLLNCGLLDCLARRGPQDSADYIRAAGAVQRLTLPREMGEVFKVLALGRGIDAPLLGFASGDRTHAL
ncbi:MAG: SAM-dependent methyltransferase [Azoarcus sp.]|jgi:SAM-dependent MidA family methyltransferase|nr:SAM-dependent methyltransferase [Azoarcus sp.]